MGAEPLVEIENVTHKFHSAEGEIIALDDLSLAIAEGEFVSIVGPSGCGKSTLLNIVAGLITPTRGRVLLENKPLRGVTSSVGYMPQTDQLFQWRTVWRNVILGLEVQNKLTAETSGYVRELLARY